MKIIEDVKGAWRHFSTIGLTALVLLPGVWAELPADIKAALPAGAQQWVSITIALWALVGKFIQQPPRQRRKPRRQP